MKKIFVLGCMLAGAFTVSAQQSSLLEKYRNMALEYNHDPVSYTHLTLPTICSV